MGLIDGSPGIYVVACQVASKRDLNWRPEFHQGKAVTIERSWGWPVGFPALYQLSEGSHMRYIEVLPLCAVALALTGCNQETTACSAPSVLPGLAAVVSDPENSKLTALLSGAYLAETKSIRSDDATGAVECWTRFIVPTEAGPMDTWFEYRVGPAASNAEMKFMHVRVNDPEIMRYYDDLVRIAEKTM